MQGGEPHRVLIAGAGVAGLETLLALRDLAEGRVRVALIAPEGEFAYRPLAVAEPFEAGEAHGFDLADLLADLGAERVQDSLAGRPKMPRGSCSGVTSVSSSSNAPLAWAYARVIRASS